METPDMTIAGKYLRRIAPMQTHDNRRNFLAAADVLEGKGIEGDNCVVYSFPVKVDGELKGYFEYMVSSLGVSVRFSVVGSSASGWLMIANFAQPTQEGAGAPPTEENVTRWGPDSARSGYYPTDGSD